MKLLIYGVNYHPELTGMGKYSGEMAEWLAARGLEVRVVTAPLITLKAGELRLFEQRWMDEHIVLQEGQSITFDGDFVDDNLNSVAWFIDKHNQYASREMIDIIN